MAWGKVDRVVRAAYLVVPGWVLDVLGRVTAADRDALLLRYAVSWLVANELVTVAEPAAFERLLAMELPEPFAADMWERLQEAVGRGEGFD